MLRTLPIAAVSLLLAALPGSAPVRADARADAGCDDGLRSGSGAAVVRTPMIGAAKGGGLTWHVSSALRRVAAGGASRGLLRATLHSSDDAVQKTIDFHDVLDRTSPSARTILAPELATMAPAARASAIERIRRRKLDAIASAPFVMAPPELFLNDPSHLGFRTAQRARPMTVFASTSDGLLHAFTLDDDPATAGDETGNELWAFAPRMLLAKLADPGFEPGDGTVAGAPIVRDVQDGRVSAAAPGPWRSLLIAAPGSAPGFHALDVSDPRAPAPLWELSAATPGLAALAPHHGTVGIGRVVANGAEVPAAFLPGGFDPGDPGKGRVLAIVNLTTGAVLRTFQPSCAGQTDCTVTALDAAVSGTPAVFDDLPGAFATRVFVGDAKGRMWRIDVSSADPAKWTMQRFWPAVGSADDIAANQRPVLLAPSLWFDLGRRLVVGYGTGSPSAKSRDDNLVWAIREELAHGPAPGEPPVVTPSKLWGPRRLAAGEQAVGDLSAFAGVLFFTTHASADQPCQPGTARLYALGLADGAPKWRLDPADPSHHLVAFSGEGREPAVVLGAGIPGTPLLRATPASATIDKAGRFTFSGGAYRAIVELARPGKPFEGSTVIQPLGPIPRRADVLSIAEYE